VDTREFGRKPWDGREDPKPNVKGANAIANALIEDLNTNPEENDN